jgi:chemotaxis protein MotB
VLIVVMSDKAAPARFYSDDDRAVVKTAAAVPASPAPTIAIATPGATEVH